jgi:hypothetical protein
MVLRSKALIFICGFVVLIHSFHLFRNEIATTGRLPASIESLRMSTFQNQLEILQKQVMELQRENDLLRSTAFIEVASPALPEWFESLKKSPSYVSTVDDYVSEWKHEAGRQLDGFCGTDFCHSRSRAPVRVLEYIIVNQDPSADAIEGASYPKLVAPVYFTPQAESHRGLCHGGSMCALMDDAIGWMVRIN